MRSGGTVRDAREDSGMTQRALADAVGIKQANIAAIETGRRPVSTALLERILEAADYRPSLPLAQKAEEIAGRGRALGITNIRVFGSVAAGTDHYDSDIDLLVDLAPGAAGFELGAFASIVEEITGFRVDVVVDRGSSASLARIRETSRPLL